MMAVYHCMGKLKSEISSPSLKRAELPDIALCKMGTGVKSEVESNHSEACNNRASNMSFTQIYNFFGRRWLKYMPARGLEFRV